MKLIANIQMMELGSEYIAIPLGNYAEKIHGVIRLNETGKYIWDFLSEGLDETEIAKKLTSEYDIDEKSALEDVREVINKLKKEGLIVE